MQLKIAKWGNSLALRLPREVARETKLTEGSTVSVEMRHGAIVLTPVGTKPELSDLLSRMPEAGKGEEFDWGRPEGNEAW